MTATSCQQITVGMADLQTASGKDGVLITHALGSCLGITVHDPVAGVSGMLHAMLPDSTIDTAKSAQNPYMFIDTGVPLLFRKCYELGAVKSRLVVKVAGGASNQKRKEDDFFRIGERNFVALRKLLWRNNVLIKSYDVGGSQSRTMILDLTSGDVMLKIAGTMVRI